MGEEEHVALDRFARDEEPATTRRDFVRRLATFGPREEHVPTGAFGADVFARAPFVLAVVHLEEPVVELEDVAEARDLLLVRPEKALRRMLPWVEWLFSAPFLLLTAVAALAGVAAG